MEESNFGIATTQVTFQGDVDVCGVEMEQKSGFRYGINLSVLQPYITRLFFFQSVQSIFQSFHQAEIVGCNGISKKVKKSIPVTGREGP
jgi:hypothetical protein